MHGRSSSSEGIWRLNLYSSILRISYLYTSAVPGEAERIHHLSQPFSSGAVQCCLGVLRVRQVRQRDRTKKTDDPLIYGVVAVLAVLLLVLLLISPYYVPA